MKTSVEISDGLFRQAKEVARRESTTVRALIEEGLRKVVNERQSPPAFELRDGSVDGNGLNPELQGSEWEHIRRLAYGEERGG